MGQSRLNICKITALVAAILLVPFLTKENIFCVFHVFPQITPKCPKQWTTQEGFWAPLPRARASQASKWHFGNTNLKRDRCICWQAALSNFGKAWLWTPGSSLLLSSCKSSSQNQTDSDLHYEQKSETKQFTGTGPRAWVNQNFPASLPKTQPKTS